MFRSYRVSGTEDFASSSPAVSAGLDPAGSLKRWPTTRNEGPHREICDSICTNPNVSHMFEQDCSDIMNTPMLASEASGDFGSKFCSVLFVLGCLIMTANLPQSTWILKLDTVMVTCQLMRLTFNLLLVSLLIFSQRKLLTVLSIIYRQTCILSH